MSVGLPVKIVSQYWKVAIPEVKNITSLIFLSCSMFKSNWLEAGMSRVFSVFPVKSYLSRFWTTLLGPRLNDSMTRWLIS